MRNIVRSLLIGATVLAATGCGSGLALRLARVKRYRTDKRAEDADTIETVRTLHAAQLARSCR
jgi:ATP-dependent DNA ligase